MTRAAPVVVVGAGPAGLTAAIELASAALPVVLIDAGRRPGGQYWRHAEDSPPGDPAYRRLADRLARSTRSGAIDHRPGREVWLITGGPGGWRLRLRPTGAAQDRTGESVLAERLVLCPGGHDRQLPVPGWDLPGVYAAGGLQALLKEHRTLPGRRVVIAGTGPFLLPVATGLAGAGAEVRAVCEANALSRWLRSAPAVAAVPSKIIEGARYAAALARRRIPYRTRTVVGEIRGADRARSVRLDRVDGAGAVVRRGVAELEVDAVGLGWGFTPALELIMMVGAGTGIGADGGLVAEVDAGQRSTVPGVYVAGEACGVGGSVLAAAEGELAARTLLADRSPSLSKGHRLSKESNPSRSSTRLERRIRRHRAFAAAMHRSHPVPTHWPDWCTGDTLVCRCEEVGLADTRRASAELGAAAARDHKLLARCGMGWCQGRICGPIVAGLAARLAGREVTPDDLRAMAKRTFAAPVPLGELAALADQQDDGES